MRIAYTYFDLQDVMPIHSFEVIRELSRLGHEVTLYTSLTAGSALARDLARLGVEIIRIPSIRPHVLNELLFLVCLGLQLMWHGLRRRPDIMYIRHASPSLVAGWVGKLLGVPPHFTDKARVDAIVKNAGFEHHTFVIASFFYQNFLGMLAPQKQQDGSLGWTLPIDPSSRSIHMGDIAELGKVVAGAFAHPEKAGDGQYLPLVGDFLSFNEVIETLNKQGHTFTFNQVPREVFANFFPGARELAEMFGYFEDHTYLGANSGDQIALAHEIAGKPATDVATWALSSMPSKSR